MPIVTWPPNHSSQPAILIVDDSPSNLHVLAHALQNKYDVIVATNGHSVLQILETQPHPDLILLDIMMPDMDGHEVCRRLKSNAGTRNIPVIFVTARDSLSDQQLGFNLGAVDYITKPVEVPLLLARVDVHIRLKLKSERLEELAMVDGLTDIANRRALDEALRRESGRAAREQSSLAVLMIDIDHFKEYNDHYGHGAGDACLRKVAHRLKTEVHGPSDVVARYGGEEFCIVLPNCDAPNALHVAEHLRLSIEALHIPHLYSSVSGLVTVSIGCSARHIPPSEAGSLSLRAEADEALYTAKSQGRNRVVLRAGPDVHA